MLKHLIFLLLLWQAADATENNSTQVCTLTRCYNGIRMRGYQNGWFKAFLGIAYAKPPVNELRFSYPQPLDGVFPSVRSIYNATVAKPDCIQRNYILPGWPISGAEDCLYLNVYVPARRAAKPLPVIVYIHGGGWFSGSAGPAITGPEYLMDTGAVVLVTLAYRLGPFGFLSTNDAHMPGNLGLWDQQLALRWVRRNIEAFGGDYTRVTLMGQSAGAVSAHMHAMSSVSKGYFAGLITLSGTANVPFAMGYEPVQQAYWLAEVCGIANANALNTAQLANELRKIDAESMLLAGDALKYWDVDNLVNFRPIVENSATTPRVFFREDPRLTLASGDYHAVPWLAVGVPGEGAIRAISILESQILLNEFNMRVDEHLARMLELPAEFSAAQLTAKAAQVYDAYFGRTTDGKHEINASNGHGLIDLISDRGFHYPFYQAARSFQQRPYTSKARLYTLRFNYTGSKSYASIYTANALRKHYGVVHCDDLLYTFQTAPVFGQFERNSTEAEVIRSYTNVIVNFAKYLNPWTEQDLIGCYSLDIQSDGKPYCYKSALDTAMKCDERCRTLWPKILEDTPKPSIKRSSVFSHHNLFNSITYKMKRSGLLN